MTDLRTIQGIRHINLPCLSISRFHYDKVFRGSVKRAEAELEVPVKLIRLTKITINNTNQVRVGADITESFQVHNGFRLVVAAAF